MTTSTIEVPVLFAHPVPCVAVQVGTDSLGRPRRRLPTVCKIARGVFLTERGCWQNTLYLNDAGYGFIDGVGAHRFMYELLVGPIPDGMELDHLCRNPPCVNPVHLEPVTPQENQRRGLHGVLKTRCPAGHSYSEFGSRRARGTRECRECHRLHEHAKRGHVCSCANGRCRDCRVRKAAQRTQSAAES